MQFCKRQFQWLSLIHIYSKQNGICGVVSKLLTVDEKYVVALETALGRAMQNIVTDNEETAKKCVEMLKKSHGGRATFLPLMSVKGEIMKNAPKNENGYIGIASVSYTHLAKSKYSLYNEDIASFGDSHELYSHKDAEGFINLCGLPLKVRALMNEKNKNN